MSTYLAEHASDTGLLMTARYFRWPSGADDTPEGMAKRGGGSSGALPAAALAGALPPLESLPWLTQTGLPLNAVGDDAGPIRPGRGRFLLHAGIAAALAVVCGGVWHLGDATVPQPAPQVTQAELLRGNTSAPPSDAAMATAGDTAPAIGEGTAQGNLPAGAQQALVAAQTGSGPLAQPRAGAARLKPVAATPVTASPAAEQAAMADAAAIVAPPPPLLANSPAAAATLKEYRSAVDECRDRIRDVIRLADRNRPGPRASAEEQTSYRLRQQNAEAAKSYRSYLDTLARSMRGTTSEAVARQSLERARQTLGYVNTMLSDSKASIR